MRKWKLGLGAVALSTACDAPPARVDLAAICPAPIEVDHTPDDSNGDGFLEDYIAEEVMLVLSQQTDKYAFTAARSEVTFTSYEVNYLLLNVDDTAPQMPSYSNGVEFTMLPNDGDNSTAAADETDAYYYFPVRAVSFDQKEWALDAFGPYSELNAQAELILTGSDQNGHDYELVGQFDIIFANFAEGFASKQLEACGGNNMF